jgi:hypothetical protein
VTLLDLVRANLLSPAVLCFALGALAVALRSDLKLPDGLFTSLSIFLMLAIGLRGGSELMEAPGREVLGALLAAFALGCAIPLWTYPILRRLCGRERLRQRQRGVAAQGPGCECSQGGAALRRRTWRRRGA